MKLRSWMTHDGPVLLTNCTTSRSFSLFMEMIHKAVILGQLTGITLPVGVWCRSNCCILNTGNSCAPWTHVGPLRITNGITQSTVKDIGKLFSTSRISGTFSNILKSVELLRINNFFFRTIQRTEEQTEFRWKEEAIAGSPWVSGIYNE